MSLVPESGDNIGNVSLREQLQERIDSQGDHLTDEEYWLLRDSLIDSGLLEQGRGRGGSVHRVRTVLSGSQAEPRTGADTTPALKSPTITVPETPEIIEGIKEASLYEPFHNAIMNGYT